MKKVLSLILAVIMVFVLATPIVTATNHSPFITSAVTVMSLLPQGPPQRPTAASISAVSVTLNEIPGAEYGINLIDSAPDAWQDSVFFGGLAPDTPYYFFARMKATDTHLASPPSLRLTVTTDMAALVGTVTIDGIAKFGQELTVITTDLTTDPSGVNMGTLIYQWRRGVTSIGTNSPNYTLVQADIGHTITVTVTAETYIGEVVSAPFGPIEKADGPVAPEVDGSYTGDGTVFTYTVDYIPGAEYRMDNGDWQDSNVFTGIVPSVPMPSHTFHARIKETLTHNAGDVGSTGLVNFERLNDRTSPLLNHSVTGDFPDKTVTIVEVPGAEYSFDGVIFDQTNTRTSSEAEELTLFIRWVETLTHIASDPPNRLIINTAYQEQDPPPDFSLTYRSVSETSYIVSIPIRAGAEYSFDGLNWSDINEMPGLLPGQTITGFMRMAARPGYNPSPSAYASVTLPLFQVRAPTFTPNSGTSFVTALRVTINSATVDATIHYTLDGTPPTTDSPVYEGIFTLTETTTVRAIAVKEGMADSAVVSATFTKGSGDAIGGFGGGGGGPVDSTPDPDPSDPTDTAIDPTAAPLAGIGRYDDVTAADWFYEAVEYVSEMGLMTGTGERIFSPHATMTRAMLVTVLYRLEGEPTDDPESEPADEPEDEPADELADELADDPESEPADDSEGELAEGPEPEPADDPESEPADEPESEIQRPLFSDTVEGTWYYDAVVWAAENNIVDGYPDGMFGVYDPVTREQTVAILYRYANWKELDVSATAVLSGFADVGDISAWALNAMRWAVTDGIVQGRTPTSIAPQGTSTRAEVATIFTRYIAIFS